MQNYSIMPLDIDHIDEICEDIKMQYENNIATCALFSIQLTPEGDPAIDKAAIACEKYDKFRDRLAQMGLQCGILAQATIGHGYPLNEPFGFQRYIGVKTGGTSFTCCPYDEGFLKYIKQAFKTLASHNPKVIMVDDDLRLAARGLHGGCACPLHLAKISETVGKKLTREELFQHTTKKDKESLKITKVFINAQIESLVMAAKAMREGIDEVNPSIPGSFCCCGDGAEGAADIAEILAGKGNPVTVRVNNGHYTAVGARDWSHIAYRASVQKIHMGKKVDVFLAETDTCPQNRYSTSANMLHAQFVVSILEGVAGAKHWITRMAEYEPESGTRYRKVLSENAGLYETLSSLVPTLSWVGANNFLSNVPAYGYENEFNKGWYWANCVLERMGIPMFFSNDICQTVFLDGDDAYNFTDEECIKILSGNAVLSSNAAKIFQERGYGEYLGVKVNKWNGPQPSRELILESGKKMTVQNEIMELVPISDKTKADSMVYHLKGGKDIIMLFPGCTVFKNSLGGKVAVFSGTPKAVFSFKEAFSFLNQSRKAQLISLLSKMGNLPVYFEGDDEVYMKAASTENGELFCSLINTGFDEIDNITLRVEKEVKGVKVLKSSGEWEECTFDFKDNLLTVNYEAPTLKPVILIIK